jgi:hypothetical protein
MFRLVTVLINLHYSLNILTAHVKDKEAGRKKQTWIKEGWVKEG